MAKTGVLAGYVLFDSCAELADGLHYEDIISHQQADLEKAALFGQHLLAQVDDLRFAKNLCEILIS